MVECFWYYVFGLFVRVSYNLINCMDRDIPTFNHLIMNKMNQKNLEAHQKRLQNIKV